MGLSMPVGVTALASLGALSSVVKAQGFYYQDIGVQCNARYNYQYLGCAATTSAPFAFAPTGWDPAATADNSRSYINFDIGDFVNMTITPYFCAQTCRAHGFKYAALWDKGCHCGSSLDYTTTGGVNVTLSNLINANSDTVCTTGADNNQWPPCGGDRRENCGSNRGARIFVDPSFPDERKLTDFAIIAQGYALLGCFKNARFPSAVDSVTSVSVQSTATCLQYCADLGMPYAYMARDVNQGDINCNCGSEFNKKTSQVSSDTNGCSEHCSDPSQRTGCTGQDCCGSGSGPFPVYANPQLMGCFTPIIPGMADPDVDDPAPDGYDCFPTPRSIQARAASPVVKYAARTMSASASFVATASPAANAFVNYGCWQNTLVGDLLDAVTTATIPNNTINVDTCVKFCDSNNHRFAALYGAPPNSQCACGDTLKSNVTPNGAMEDCNQPCPGSAQQNCGGDKGPLLYARSDVTPNQWAQLYTSSWSHTVVYSCTSSTSSSSTTSSTTTSLPTTTITVSTSTSSSTSTSTTPSTTTSTTASTTTTTIRSTTQSTSTSTTRSTTTSTTRSPLSTPTTSTRSSQSTSTTTSSSCSTSTSTTGSSQSTCTTTTESSRCTSTSTTRSSQSSGSASTSCPISSLSGAPTGGGNSTAPRGNGTIWPTSSAYGTVSYGVAPPGAVAYETASSGIAPSGTASHGTASYGTASYGTASYGTASYGPASYGIASYEIAYGVASHEPASSGTASYGTASASSTATGYDVSGITNLPDGYPIILEVAPCTTQKRPGAWDLRRHIPVKGFVGGAGTASPDICDKATLFTLHDGQLSSGGKFVATDPGAANMPFQVVPWGPITTTFSIERGVLHWNDAAFAGSEAEFCQTADGTVHIVFQGPSSRPAKCERVDLVAYYASQCVKGQIIPYGAGRPYKDWIFDEGSAPDNNPCLGTTLDWVPGAPTFLPGHDEL